MKHQESKFKIFEDNSLQKSVKFVNLPDKTSPKSPHAHKKTNSAFSLRVDTNLKTQPSLEIQSSPLYKDYFKTNLLLKNMQ